MRSEHSSRLSGFLGGVAVGSAATMVLVRDALPRLVDRYRSARPAASPVQRPALIINPRSGDGKSQRYGLPDRARELGIAVRVLEHGEDLRQLAREVIDAGADAVGMAGGDGSLGLVAQVAIESDVPFFCVPLGTRNHFALDIGLNRDHPLSALHAVKSGQEIAVDYGLAGDRVFVNNVSFGLYARAVHSEGYRQDKIGTLVAVAKQMAAAPGTGGSVRFAMPDGAAADDAAVLLVSNNRYVWSGPPDFGRRASMDGGELGILSVLSIPRGADVGSLTMRDLSSRTEWSAAELAVHSEGATIAVGLDGESVMLPAPVELRSVPGGLRLLLPTGARPGYVPPAAAAVARLLDLASLSEDDSQ